MTQITNRSLASSVPGARLAYLLHISFSLSPYCKHYAKGPAGTDLARAFLGITVTGITRGIVRWITPIPIDSTRGIPYARGFGCCLIADQHFSCFPTAIPWRRMAVCIFSTVFPGFEELVPVYTEISLHLSLYTVLYICSTPFSILCTLYRYNKTRYIVYTGFPFSTTDQYITAPYAGQGVII